MRVECYTHRGLSSRDGSITCDFPAFLDREMNFDRQVREYVALGLLNPVTLSEVMFQMFPSPSWTDVSVGFTINATKANFLEITIEERKGGDEVELYEPDEFGLLRPIYPEDLPKVFSLSSDMPRFALAGRKKGEPDIRFLNSVKHIPASTD